MASGVVSAGVLLWHEVRYAAEISGCSLKESKGFLRRVFTVEGTDKAVLEFRRRMQALANED